MEEASIVDILHIFSMICIAAIVWVMAIVAISTIGMSLIAYGVMRFVASRRNGLSDQGAPA
jgi:hypothetical protein